MTQNKIAALNEVVQDLQRRLVLMETSQGTGVIHEYQDQLCSYNNPGEVDLNIFKTLPMFSWRRTTFTEIGGRWLQH